MAFNLGDIFVTFKAKSEGFQQAIANVKAAGDNVKGVTDKIGKFGEGAAAAGKKLTTTMTLPLIAAGVGALKMSTDFNSAMANIATLIPGNAARIDELKASIQDMAVETGKSTADLSDGMYQVISAFGDTAASANILKINAKAAAAGMAETTDAINLTSGVTKAYGDTTDRAVQKASDLALMTVRLGQTTFPELAASMGRVTPLAAALNVSQEELFGTMATFTGVTGGAAEVSTQLRGVLQSLMAPTADMQDLMKKLGYENGQAMIKQLGLQGSIEAMTKAANDSGKPLQAYIGSIEGQTLALAATGGQADVYSEKIKAMGNVAGTTDQAFNEMTQGVNKTGFELEQAKQKAAVAAQKMGDALAPALSKVAEWIGKVADWFSKLSPKGQKVVLIIAAIVAAIGPMLVILGQLAMGIRAIGAAFAFLSANPVVLAIIAIILVIAGLAYLIITNWSTLQAWMATFWNWLVGVATGVWSAIMTGLQAVGDFFAMIWDNIKGIVLPIFDAIKFAAQIVFAIIGALIVVNLIIWTAIFQAFGAVIGAVWDAIKAAAMFVWNAITAYFKFVIGVWTAIFSAIFNALKGPFEAAWNWIKGVFGGIGKWFGDVINGIKTTFSNIVGVISGPFKTAFNAIAGFWNNSIGKLTWKAPDWIPGIGGKEIGVPKLPMLAQGGIASKATLAMIGEGTEPEAVIPLSKIGQVAAQMGVGGDGGGTHNEFNFQGVMARSETELRDIIEGALASVDQRRIAQGKKPLLG